MQNKRQELETYVESHLVRRRYSPNTIKPYMHWVMRISDFFGKYKIEEFTADDVIEFIKDIEDRQGLSTGTVRVAENALHFFFNTLGKCDYKIRGLRSKTIPRKLRYVPTQKEIINIIEHAPSKRTRLVLTLLYATGLTLEEVVSLKRNDIDFEKNSIRIQNGKVKKSRQAVLAEYVKPQLYSYIRNSNPSKWVFETDKGNQIGINNIQQAITKAANELNIKHQVTAKSFRYAYVKHLETIGFYLLDILDELQMNPRSSFEYYAKLGRTRKKINVSPIDRRIPEESIGLKKAAEIFYVSESRINELSEIQDGKFDLTKLLELLREINIASRNQMYLSVAMLVRSVMDHIPPIFGLNTFSELSNNYSGGQSFKKQMGHMHNSLRNIADSFLHMTIRTSEVLPNFNQVDFRADLDVLLGEVVRILKKHNRDRTPHH